MEKVGSMEKNIEKFGMVDPYKWIEISLFKYEGRDKRSTEINKLCYALYRLAGRPLDKQHASRNPYSVVIGGYGEYAPMYNPEMGEAEAWEVPNWALFLASEIKHLITDAEAIAREKGYNSGLGYGKSCLKQLAAGEVTVDDFSAADGRDERRLTRKKW